jgi:hypothetical protein
MIQALYAHMNNKTIKKKEKKKKESHCANLKIQSVYFPAAGEGKTLWFSLLTTLVRVPGVLESVFYLVVSGFLFLFFDNTGL